MRDDFPQAARDFRAAPADDRLELREAAALPQRTAVLHRADQHVVETLNGIAAARRRGRWTLEKILSNCELPHTSRPIPELFTGGGDGPPSGKCGFVSPNPS